MTETNTGTTGYQPQPLELIILFLSLLSLVFIDAFQVDFIAADWIYQHTHWAFKKSFIFETILHKTARVILIALYLSIVYVYIKKLRFRHTTQARHLLILIISIGSSVLWVTILKRLLEVDCPWDLVRYGGDVQFQSVFNYVNNSESAHCFPASHASVGYSWVAVYFYCLVTTQPKARKVLLLALMMGVIFGMAQQLRGAHFISHDIWSLVICLSNTMAIYWLAYQNKKCGNTWLSYTH